MTRLRWRDAEHRDRTALQTFLCTPPVVKRVFGRSAPPRPRQWELDVQGGVRALQPPAHANELILIGEDDDGIAAVAHAEADGSWETAFIALMAVALRVRRFGAGSNGMTVGDLLVDELTYRLAARADAAGFDYLTMWGWIDPQNKASQVLCARNGWAPMPSKHDQLERWVTRIDFR